MWPLLTLQTLDPLTHVGPAAKAGPAEHVGPVANLEFGFGSVMLQQHSIIRIRIWIRIRHCFGSSDLDHGPYFI